MRRKSPRLPISVRNRLLEALAWQIPMGLPDTAVLQGVIDSLKKRSKNKRSVPGLEVMLYQLQAGRKLSDVLRPFVGSTQYVILAAGESAGDMAAAIQNILELDAQRNEILRYLYGAMVSPLMYIAALIVTLTIMATQVIPPLSEILPPQQWQGLGRMIYDSTLVVQPRWGLLIVGMVGFGYLSIRNLLPRWTGPLRLRCEQFIPGFGLYRDIQGALWLRSFSAMLRARIPDTVILELQIRDGTPWLRERLSRFLQLMVNGFSFSEALVFAGPGNVPLRQWAKGKTFDFPAPEIADDVATFSGHPNFEMKLMEISDKWVAKLEHNLRRSAGLLATGFQFLIFGYFILMTLGINEISDQIGRSLHG